MPVILLGLLVLLLPLQLGRHFWPADSYIFGLKVDYLSPTFYLQDIIILWLIFLKKKEIFLFFMRRKKLLVPYFLLLITNVLFSLTPLLSFFAWLRISEFVLLGLIISKNSGRVLAFLEKFLPFILFFEFGLSLVQVLKQSSVNGLFWFFGERTFNLLTPGIAKGVWLGNVFLRPYGTFSHPNSLAGFTLIAIIFILGKKKLNSLDKLSVFSGFALILLCFSRTVWLAVLLIGISFVFRKVFSGLRNGFKSKKLSLNFPYLFSLASILVTIFLFLRTTMEASSLENRRKLAEYALLIIKRNPLFGVGANNFIVSLAQKNTAWEWFYWLQPVHNLFLLIASEMGLIGFAFFLTFLWISFKRLPEWPIFIALLAILFTGFFDHYWLTLIQNQILFVIVLSLCWGKENVKISR